MNSPVIEVWEWLYDLIHGWYWLPLLLAYIGIIISILLDNRNPVKSIAYIMLLTFLPVLGLVVYYFFGRDYRKQRIFNLKAVGALPLMERFWSTNMPEFEKRFERCEAHVGDLIAPAKLIFNLHQGLLSENNTVELLVNGEQKFPRVFEALEAAQHHIHIEYYIFTYDNVGRKVVDILMRKAKAGVEVRLVIDDMGSKNNKRMVRRLKRAGIDVHRFMPVTFPFAAQANFRDHRKIIVVDGKVGFLGGINMDDRYLNNGKHKLFWRDTHMRVEGPLLSQLQLQFLLSWHFTARKTFPLTPPYFENSNPENGTVRATMVASGPDSPRPFCMEAILAAINRANKSIRIATPYFIPSDQIMTALLMAASNGVDVQLMLPGKTDSYIVQHASFSYLKPLLRGGVRVFLYERGFMHAKTITIDDQLAIVGTVNMDTRSFYINFEMAALVYDPKFCHDLDQAFDEDLQYSRVLNYNMWTDRFILYRIVDSICRLLTPIL
ncbi:cardiolipin synthase [Chryseolinea lacunae]|uniref:Cardiolipin synthase n=1 Tax=Chryseolinea lacunae TaxID=2801331 RepID=A0ABS1KW39_9BACT|nr:cardiolipin synthase [Chryseolinea lacunae]